LIKGQCMKSYCLENKRKSFAGAKKLKVPKKIEWMPFSVEYLCVSGIFYAMKHLPNFSTTWSKVNVWSHTV